MKWNWQKNDWPNFQYDAAALDPFECEFLTASGMLQGMVKHISHDDRDSIAVELLSSEAMSTSQIEGEHLNRASVQSSICRYFGLEKVAKQVGPAEQGIAAMMIDLYRDYASPLSEETLFRWHEQIMSGRFDLSCIGMYRVNAEPMQIISGSMRTPKVHFEAPPADRMPKEMSAFIDWYNETAPTGSTPLPALTRAGLVHLYFISIHPFEDGNGRIGRALVDKAISQSCQFPMLLALSQTIHQRRKLYYHQLESNSQLLDVTEWLLYFSEVILKSRLSAQYAIERIIMKTQLFDQYGADLNERQIKVLNKLFSYDAGEFEGGLSASNYCAITKTSASTATRDLKDLLDKGILRSQGERKHTRYYLKYSVNSDLNKDFSTNTCDNRDFI